MNSEGNEVSFYRALASVLIAEIENKDQQKFLDVAEISDRDGRLQLTIRTKDRRKGLVVLNFSGSAPFLHLGEAAANPLQVVAPNEVIVLGWSDVAGGDKRFSVDELGKLIGQRITAELNSQAAKV